MKKKLIIFIVIVQVAIVAFQIFNILNARKRILGIASSNAVDKKDVNFSQTGNLKYFYEPKPNSLRLDDSIGIGKGNYINSDSLNERFDYSVEKPDGVFRIITLGDSITYGMHVATKDNWTELLEDKLNSELKCSNIKKFEVINLGVWGYDNQYSVERYRVRGQKYSPDLLLWYQANLLQADEEINRLVYSYMETATKSADYRQEDYQKIKFDNWIRSENEIYKKLGESKLLDLQKDAIYSLEKYYSGKIVFVEFPEMPLNHKEFLKQTLSANKNYYLLDNTRDYLKEGGAVDASHPNKKGHQMISEDIFNFLKENNIVSCK